MEEDVWGGGPVASQSAIALRFEWSVRMGNFPFFARAFVSISRVSITESPRCLHIFPGVGWSMEIEYATWKLQKWWPVCYVYVQPEAPLSVTPSL
jgi:hypothetical protein